MSIRQAMPHQEAEVRNKNFSEVALGYTAEMAQAEAKRCLQCKNPACKKGCPVNVDIPEFIGAMVEKDLKKSFDALSNKNTLPAICGRVCPQENQCEKFCILGIKSEPVAIGRLERFVADYARKANYQGENKSAAKNNIKVAVVGSGPSGLTVAGDLAKLGYSVTVFEGLHAPGGVLVYGIPEFRLPKEIVNYEINNLKNLGVEIVPNTIIGATYTVDELLNEENFAAVYIGSGAGLPYFMEIEGENLNGVYSANEFLTRSNLMKAYQFPNFATPIHVGKNVAVVGAGNVAMDAARTAKRLGAKNSYIVYRRGMDEMPARMEEIEHAKEEGVILKLLTNPVKIMGNDKGWVSAMECVEMELGEPDQSGRRRPVEKKASNFVLEVDTVIMAIGQGPNPLIARTTEGLMTNKRGNIVADEQGKTSYTGVFAGGDIVTGAATVISAMGAGRVAAQAIDEYIKNRR